MGIFGSIGKFFGISPKGEDMSAEESAQEDTIQEALDKAYGTPGTFGQRKISADDAENALRKQGILPAGWRLRESDSTSSGFRPTQAASKKMGALHAGEVAGAAFGGAAALGAGPLAGLGTAANLGTNAAIQGGLGAAQGAAQGGWKGALLGGGLGAAGGLVPGLGPASGLKNTLVQSGLGAARGLATGGGLKGALLGGALGAGGAQATRIAPSLTSSALGQKAINTGVTTGLQTAGTGSFNPYQAALGAGRNFLPDVTQSLTSSPLGQRTATFGGNQLLNLVGGGGRFNPLQAGVDAWRQIPGRAGGGDVDPDQPVVVGEKGPEVIVPKLPSTVIPNPNTAPAATPPVAPAAAAPAAATPPAATTPPATPAPGTTAPDAPLTFGQRWGAPIAQGLGTLGGIYAARKAQQDALQRSPEEQLAINNVMGPGGSPETAKSLMMESRPYITKPASYYQTLLNGNRAAMAQAVAPERAALNESYRGAGSQLATSGIRGAARDVLAGNLARDKAAKVAGLTTGVQPAAAGALAGLGQNLQQTAVPLYGQATNFYGQLLDNGLRNRAYAAAEGRDVGSQAGKLIADLGTAAFGGKGKAPAAKKPGTDVGSSATVPEPGYGDRPPTYGPDYGPQIDSRVPDLGPVDPGMLPGGVGNPPPLAPVDLGDYSGSYYDPY